MRPQRLRGWNSSKNSLKFHHLTFSYRMSHIMGHFQNVVPIVCPVVRDIDNIHWFPIVCPVLWACLHRCAWLVTWLHTAGSEVGLFLGRWPLKLHDVLAYATKTVMILVWFDKCPVYMPTTYHDASTQTVQRRTKGDTESISKSTVTIDYTAKMGAVDLVQTTCALATAFQENR